MSEIKKAPLVASHLQRAALTAGPQSGLSLSSKLISGSVVTSSSSPGAALKKPAGVGTESSLVNPSHRPVRKQANPVKQTVVVTPSSTSTVIASATNPAPRTTKFNAPPPPPLIPTVPRQQLLATCSAGGGGGFKASLAVRRPVPQPSTKTNNATNATPSQAKKPETAVGASSESSSEYSSSDSSDTSGEEDHTKKKLEGPPSNIETPGPSVVAKGDTSGEGAKKEGSQNTKLEGPPAITATPGPSGFAKRGRGRPRLSTSTPRPAKQVKPGGQRAKSTPRKKSDRVPKPPVIFSPDTAAGKAALPKRRGRGCGGCMGCMRDDCGKCNYCKDKTKFGGPGKKKQRCLLRVCSNFVKPVYGKTRPIHPGSPPSEIAVIPVTKLASSLKVAEVIEQLRQNLTASIPQVIDKDSLPGVLPTLAAAAAKATSFIISQPQQLKTTPSAIASVSETKIVGPVIPPTTISKTPPTTTVPTVTTTTSTLAVVSEASKPPESKKQTQEVEAPKSSDAGKKEEVEKTPVAVATKAPDTSKAPEVSKSSEIALRTRRKQQQQPPQQQQVKETVTSSAPAASTSGEDKVKCIVCGRERKPSLMRSSQFCTQRCINSWTERNGKGAEPQSSTTSSSRRSVETPMEVEKPTPPHQPKKLPRALKNLKIDMAWDRTSGANSRAYTSTASSTPKPTMTSTPTPTATTATNKRPTSSIGIQPTPGRKMKDLEVAVGTKRPSQQQPPQNQKKMKEAEPAKSVSFNLTTIPTSTVVPISAPPLSRTVPPPSISIVPLDQLTALGTALLSQQQQQRNKKDEPPADTVASPVAKSAASGKIPSGLPVDVRSWTISQVVKFFESTSDCKDYAAVFREQEVDGTALLLLTHESLVKCLGIKLGRALKIMAHVEELQKLYA